MMRASLGLLAAALLTGGCGQPQYHPRSLPDAQRVASPTRFEAVVMARYDHDASSYVEGLAGYGGILYESTGRDGRSGVRRISLDGSLPRTVWAMPDPFFGEGFAVRGHELFQLTWTEHTVFVWNLDSHEHSPRRMHYPDYGWGLEYLAEGDRFVTTNGTATISWRDPATMAVVASVEVIREGHTVGGLNELAIVGDDAWVNVYPTNEIVRVRLADGHVTGVVDLTCLAVAERGPNRPDFETNGIAWLPDRGHFLVTGKQWNHLYEVDFRETHL